MSSETSGGEQNPAAEARRELAVAVDHAWCQYWSENIVPGANPNQAREASPKEIALIKSLASTKYPEVATAMKALADLGQED